MRPRNEIEKDMKKVPNTWVEGLLLEVLLDIRDILIAEYRGVAVGVPEE